MYEVPLAREALLDSEHRLAALNVRMVVLRVPEHHIREQCVESTRQSRGPKWTQFLRQLGPTDAARADYIRQTQDHMLEWVRTSPLLSQVIETTHRAWGCYADHVTDALTN